ncbi:ABC transporter substrate-binding protein [Paenibacillus sp. PL2-23]|uniref:ABC transporter substrate-binding protein n=1 Tax=Paenibacillus sp. PL2-23 TaxID=2100729 RepID=UPI0030F4DDDD
MKKTMKMMVVIVLVAVLAACGGNNNNAAGNNEANGSNKPSNDASQETKITPEEVEFWVYEPETQERKDVLVNLIAQYEEQSGHTINTTFIPKDDFNTKLNSSIVAGQNPDVSYLDQPLVPKFAEDGVLLELEAYANGENGINKEEFYQGALGTVTVGGKLYGLPLNQTTVALFYNKDLMPTPPQTWEEWVQASSEIYKANEIAAFEGLGTGGWGAWLLPALVHSGGGTMVNDEETAATFGSEQGIAAVELVNQLLEYSDKAVRESNNAFGNGLIATKISGPWEMGGFKSNFPDLNYGVALIPHAEGQQSYSNIGGDDLVIYENTKAPEAAWDFIKFLTNDQNSILMADVTGNFPVRLAAAQDPKFSNDPDLSVFLKQMETAVARPTITEWLKINDEIIGKALEKVFIGEEDASDVMKKAAENATQIINQ